MEFICRFCNDVRKNANSHCNHERLCKSNPNKQESNFKHRRGKPAWNKGLTKKDNKILSEKSKTQSAIMKKKIKEGTIKGLASKEYQDYMQTDKYKQEQSDRMLDVVKNNPDSYSSNNVCGRNKHAAYNNETYQSTWEVIVAKYFDKFQIPFIRKVDPIEYEWNGKIRSYFPDFYMPQWDIYLEVKGYETERDHAKWSALDNLIVLKEKEIKLFEKIIGCM